MTRLERDEFWRRFHAGIERFRAGGTDCDVAINAFEVRQWDVRFTRRQAGNRPASATLTIVEHAQSTAQFLLAVTTSCSVDGVLSDGTPFLIPVFFDPAADTFSLQADHGPVEESQMSDFFARTVAALLHRS